MVRNSGEERSQDADWKTLISESKNSLNQVLVSGLNWDRVSAHQRPDTACSSGDVTTRQQFYINTAQCLWSHLSPKLLDRASVGSRRVWARSELTFRSSRRRKCLEGHEARLAPGTVGSRPRLSARIIALLIWESRLVRNVSPANARFKSVTETTWVFTALWRIVTSVCGTELALSAHAFWHSQSRYQEILCR